MSHFGYTEINKGATSGSRVMFYRESDNDKVFLHKPHPGDIMDVAAVKMLRDHLIEKGEI